VPEADRYKFVDDLTCLEKINLLSIGLASYNCKLQVPSDIPSHGQIINSEHLKTQGYLDKISKWTSDKKMFLNEKKKRKLWLLILHRNTNLQQESSSKIQT
jgi:hypothetical protein